MPVTSIIFNFYDIKPYKYDILRYSPAGALKALVLWTHASRAPAEKTL